MSQDSDLGDLALEVVLMCGPSDQQHEHGLETC